MAAPNTNDTRESSRNAAHYRPEIPESLLDPISKVLKDYSGISEQDVEKHIHDIRDRAWDVHNYLCIGMFTFLELDVSRANAYSEVLERLKKGEKYLEVGCCFGQDIRRMVLDGAPAENIYGTDLSPEFFELGYDLFRDRGKLSSKFIGANFLKSDNSELESLKGQFSMIHASSFVHLFGYETQVEACKRLVAFLKLEPGSLIFGRQAGHTQDGVREGERSSFRHSDESWKKMWLDDVAPATGTQGKWRIECNLYDMEPWIVLPGGNDPGRRRMRFAMWYVGP